MLAVQGAPQSKVDDVSPDTIVLPNAFLGSYAALAMRLQGKTPGTELRAYIATGEPMDKAGAYGAQGRGALLVRRLDGDFFNVMGLPVLRLSHMLEEFGVFLLA